MNMRDLIDLFEAPAQGKTGAQLAQTSGGQFMNKADRTNQAKVDAALGPGFKAGTAAANMALAKKFSQPAAAPAAVPAATNAPAPSAGNELAKGQVIGNAMNPAPVADTRGAAAMASKSAPAAPEPAAAPAQTSDQIATAALNAQDNTPAADTRGAAAMASKSAPAQTSDQVATAALNTQNVAPAADVRGASAQRANPVPATTAPTQNTNSGSGYTGDVGTASNNPAPKSDYQPVAGSSNLVSRTADKIAADAKAGPGGQNQATKSYGSAGEFFGAIGDKFKSLVGGNKPVDAMANSNAGNQTSSGYTAATPAPTVAATPAAAPAPTAAAEPPLQKNAAFGQVAEEELEEDDNMELEEMMRLSGLALNEKAVSKQQQKFMGMVHAMQKGEKVKGASSELKKAAKGMSKKDAKDFASTKHKGLPKKVTEDVMLDEGGSTLNHIANRFKYEVKMFMQEGVMDNDLYEALSDYYIDRGEVPYGVAKGKSGFPEMTQWVEERFYADMGSGMSESVMTEQPVVDNTLSELARLAGIQTNEDGPGASMLYSKDKPESMTNKMKSGADSVKDFFKQGAEAYKDQYMTGLGMPPDKYTPADPRKPFGPKKSEVDEDGPGAALLYSKDKPDSFGDKLKSAGKSIRQAIDKATLPAGMHADYDRIEAEKDKREADTKSKTLGECGMDMPHQSDTMNVSTNMSSDGTKSVNISAQGDRADELLQMLKMAGMRPHDDHSVMMSEPEVIMISGDQMMDEERETEYANTPEEEYQTVDSIIRQGNDLNREKRQYADKPRLGDNPMAESMLDNDLNDILESILIRDDQDGPEIKKNPKTGRVSATYPAPKKPDQSTLPLQTEPYHGPRSLKVDGERTGTENHGKEKEVDEGWEDVSNFIGDIVGTEASKLRGSQQLRDLDAMRKQYKGTEYEKQVNDRYDTHLNRLQLDQGEVVDKAGEPIKVLPPQQWKGK